MAATGLLELGMVEGSADSLGAVKDEQWLAYGIDDGLRIKERVPKVILDFMSPRT